MSGCFAKFGRGHVGHPGLGTSRPSRKRTRSEIAGEYALIAQVATARFSQNLFPNGFSRNGASKMEKWDAPQTCICVTERLSSSIGIERCHLTRHAIYAP